MHYDVVMKTLRFSVSTIFVVSLVVLLLAGCPPGPDFEFSGDLEVPDLNITQWINEPRSDVDHNATGHVFLLEFWATWCGPCRDSIPHLNAIHRLLGDMVTVVAVTDESASTVESFVQEMGESMEFAVAIDDSDATWDAYMGRTACRAYRTLFSSWTVSL